MSGFDAGARMLPMQRRREALIAAALAPALALPWGPSKASAPDSRALVLRAVFDLQLPQSIAFARRAKSLGVSPFGYAGEMSNLWFDELLPVLQSCPSAFVGMTSAGALFCFERLAWDVGMRVRFRIEHHEAARGVRHLARAALPDAVRSQLVDAGPEYGHCAADIAVGCRAAWGDCTHAAVPSTGAPDARALVSWVIAPMNGRKST